MAIQKFNCLELLETVNTNETTRQENEITRQQNETARQNAENVRRVAANQWANATAEVVEHYSPNVILTTKDGHKHFKFWLPASEETGRDTIAAGDIEEVAKEKKRFVSYQIPLGLDINNASVGLPADLEKTFLLINLPYETVEIGDEYCNWIYPQVIMDGANIYMRRLDVTRTGTGSEDSPYVWTYADKTWNKLGAGVQ